MRHQTLTPNPLPEERALRIFSLFSPVHPKALTQPSPRGRGLNTIKSIENVIFLIAMSLLILNHSEVEQLLPMNECITVMEEAFTALARDAFHQPLRTITKPPNVKGVMALMPTFRAGGTPLFGLKAICVFPGNAEIGKDAHQGGGILFDGANGETLAMVNASAITAIRTAAVSGLATRLLARED